MVGGRFGLGIDVGGTFTDIVVYDAGSGRQASHKELTTHDDPSEGVMAGIDRVLRESAIAPGEIGRLVHATTLFTNALIERQGAPTGLITTAGFRDTLEIARERKFELYDLAIARPEPLVPRDRRLEVDERVKADGTVKRKLDRRQVEARGRWPTSACPHPSCSCCRAAVSRTWPRLSARRCRCWSRGRRRAPSRRPILVARTAAATSSPSTWAARRPSSRSSTAASR